ncbi:hypothetical protein HS048_29905 [Planomonospora sp. ID91781]|uniref:hypothetical protein n=1 Tax=Planomonospora sp. ID91781 TaxID=2738135 RepID=UPI0018C4280A|nr:hypothetical protein [Planomonospora sp. ID91781]MBG0824917.1 hypothetical protein [Planomonospora sp. ID91781]
MIPVQRAPEFSAEERIRPEVSDLVAETYGKALAVLQRLLKPHGFRAVRVHTIGMRLRGDGMPWPKASVTHHAPDLTVYGDAGRVVATVTVGLRAGCYLVSLPPAGVDCRTVAADRPHTVANMIRAAAKAAA